MLMYNSRLSVRAIEKELTRPLGLCTTPPFEHLYCRAHSHRNHIHSLIIITLSHTQHYTNHANAITCRNRLNEPRSHGKFPPTTRSPRVRSLPRNKPCPQKHMTKPQITPGSKRRARSRNLALEHDGRVVLISTPAGPAKCCVSVLAGEINSEIRLYARLVVIG
jgi:hypothetical protein